MTIILIDQEIKWHITPAQPDTKTWQCTFEN